MPLRQPSLDWKLLQPRVIRTPLQGVSWPLALLKSSPLTLLTMSRRKDLGQGRVSSPMLCCLRHFPELYQGIPPDQQCTPETFDYNIRKEFLRGGMHIFKTLTRKACHHP